MKVCTRDNKEITKLNGTASTLYDKLSNYAWRTVTVITVMSMRLYGSWCRWETSSVLNTVQSVIVNLRLSTKITLLRAACYNYKQRLQVQICCSVARRKIRYYVGYNHSGVRHSLPWTCSLPDVSPASYAVTWELIERLIVT